MRELKIEKNDSGQRINKYLLKYLNTAPSSFVYKMLRKKNITLNDKRAKGDEILNDGDIVKIFLAEETIDKFKNTANSAESFDNFTQENKSADIKLLYKTEDFIAVHKPAGVLSQKAAASDYSINEMIIDYCREQKITTSSDTFKPSVCNRLDRNTSGIILAGITLKGSQFLSKMLKERSFEKYYYAVVNGIFKEKKSSNGYIKKDSEKNISDIIDEKAYQAAHNKGDYAYMETHYEPLCSNGTYTLLKIKLVTGKSHQIRADLKWLGHSIVGDYKYGDKEANKYFKDKYGLKGQLLHAGKVILLDKTVIFDELPEIFKNICEGENLDGDLEFQRS